MSSKLSKNQVVNKELAKLIDKLISDLKDTKIVWNEGHHILQESNRDPVELKYYQTEDVKFGLFYRVREDGVFLVSFDGGNCYEEISAHYYEYRRGADEWYVDEFAFLFSTIKSNICINREFEKRRKSYESRLHLAKILNKE